MTSYVCKRDFETIELDGEWLVLNSEAYTVTTLNDVGGYCWTLLQEQQTKADIVKAIKEKYIVEEEEVTADIEAFLVKLTECGLIAHAG